MAKVRENKKLLIEAKTREELKPEIAKYRALGYKKDGAIEKDLFDVKLPYYVFMNIIEWG